MKLGKLLVAGVLIAGAAYAYSKLKPANGAAVTTGFAAPTTFALPNGQITSAVLPYTDIGQVKWLATQPGLNKETQDAIIAFLNAHHVNWASPTSWGTIETVQNGIRQVLGFQSGVPTWMMLRADPTGRTSINYPTLLEGTS